MKTFYPVKQKYTDRKHSEALFSLRSVKKTLCYTDVIFNGNEMYCYAFRIKIRRMSDGAIDAAGMEETTERGRDVAAKGEATIKSE